MRRALTYIVVAVMGLSGVVVGAEGQDVGSEAAKQLDSQTEKLSYAVGMQIADSLKKAQMELDLDAFLSGVKDSMKKNQDTALSDKEAKKVRQAYIKKRRAEQKRKRQKMAKKKKQEARKFLKKNKKKEGVEETDSGLQYKVVKKGKGPQPTVADRVKAQVVIKTMDGKEIYNSKKANRQESLPVKGLLPGLTEGMKLMKEGAEYKFFVPPKLGLQRKNKSVGQGLIIDVKLDKVLKNAATKEKSSSGKQKKK